ncbi:hypothetical protein HanRHA438_Chr07g0295571 [Helianthus annuus]|uniref:Transposase (Putative), gypsy type n=1 Tax=Helianthus annuus TaxID=4232 RepID=A0A9K3IJN2_HELAN|nr:hypothetical protein HanXRQr2_Chr07g0285031 [Helianthus annuus]KAJ0549481.1 hypothetical protein HanHA300_Chr07g0234201 [Helianthus annuus]KAJ0555876.1 hypothetical protein HanIR_Chr07g0307181 [Helianthus annuus]KAJ0562438.1 hypothetical protein HanHA89_Chr07g0251391 [Helianthus annuus]KAJ0727813.1 hypothetical protein HanLR1_Chr07g0234151 [Helianthus annuus]
MFWSIIVILWTAAPSGGSRVLHFQVLCRALGYDPTFLMFHRFFQLAKNGDWFTFETSQIDVSLISSLVTTLGSWKNRFFWVSKSVIPFKMVWRHPVAVLYELGPSISELDEGLLKALRGCPSQLRPFPEHLLVSTGPDDTSDVVLGDAEAVEGEDAIARTAEGRLVPGGKYVNIPNVKGFTKVSSSKPSTLHSSHRLKVPSQSSATNPVDLSDDIEVSEDQGVEVEAKKDKELKVVVGKKGKSEGRKVVVSAAGGSSRRSGENSLKGNASEIYVPN